MNFEPQEPQPFCPGCEGAIPQENIQRRPIDLQAAIRPAHKLLGYCEHCDRLWTVTRQLSPSGVYEIIQGPAEITDERVKRPIVRQIQRNRGNTPLHA